MPQLSDNCCATEEMCFLRSPCRVVISKTVGEGLVSEEMVGELVTEITAGDQLKLVAEIEKSLGTQWKRTVTRQRLVKTQQAEKCAVVSCNVCELVKRL
jgi:hypothetical protein